MMPTLHLPSVPVAVRRSLAPKLPEVVAAIQANHPGHLMLINYHNDEAVVHVYPPGEYARAADDGELPDVPPVRLGRARITGVTIEAGEVRFTLSEHHE
jgi:hypothetical protein